MRRQDLDKLIHVKKTPRAIMLYGESHFLIENYTKKLMKLIDAEVLSFYYDEYDFSSAKAHLSQGSLFGDANLLIIKNDKKVPKADLEKLVELTLKDSNNYLIYSYYGTDFKKSATAAFSAKKTTKEFVNEVRFFHPTANESKNILMQEAQQMGIKLPYPSALHLLLSQNSNLELAMNELNKLTLLESEITTKDIDDLVYTLAEVKLDTFIEQILKKEDFKKNLKNMLEHGEDEIRIITAISSFVTQLYLFHIYIKVNGVPSSLDILGYKLPPFIEKERANLSIKFKESQYKKMITLLTDSELELKSTKSVDKESIVISTLIELQTIV